MGRSLTPSGFAVLGQWSKGRYWSGTRSSPHRCSHRLMGFSVGLSAGSSSCATMSQWWLYLSLFLHGTNTWWGLRHLSLLATCHSFMFTAFSVRGKANSLADSLSHFQFQCFHHQPPQADLTPYMTPKWLLVALQKTWPWGVSFCSPKDSFLPPGVFISAQPHYICHWDGHLNRDGSFPPADEETLMYFPTTWPTHLLKYTCLQYAPFTLIIACRILSSTAKFIENLVYQRSW